MLKYNLYYNNEKINKRPLSQSELDKVQNLKVINKYNKITNDIVTIPTDKVEIIKCYVV